MRRSNKRLTRIIIIAIGVIVVIGMVLGMVTPLLRR
jgi:type IV secretory pathway component VirB8